MCDRLAPGKSEQTTYRLTLERTDASLVERALADFGDGPLFDADARRALDAVLPDGRYTTYGYRALPAEAFVERGGTYYQTHVSVTGRAAKERTVVRATRVDEEAVPADAPTVESLARVDARAVKILHSHAVTDGRGGSSELVEDGGYVLRRPAERKGALAAGEYDGRVVAMDEDGHWAYRVETTTETLAEPAYTVFAVDVAESEAAFREVAAAVHVDAAFAPADLQTDAGSVLERAVAEGAYEETAPLSEAFETVLSALGVLSADGWASGLLTYDGELYDYDYAERS